VDQVETQRIEQRDLVRELEVAEAREADVDVEARRELREARDGVAGVGDGVGEGGVVEPPGAQAGVAGGVEEVAGDELDEAVLFFFFFAPRERKKGKREVEVREKRGGDRRTTATRPEVEKRY